MLGFTKKKQGTFWFSTKCHHFLSASKVCVQRNHWKVFKKLEYLWFPKLQKTGARDNYPTLVFLGLSELLTAQNHAHCSNHENQYVMECARDKSFCPFGCPFWLIQISHRHITRHNNLYQACSITQSCYI